MIIGKIFLLKLMQTLETHRVIQVYDEVEKLIWAIRGVVTQLWTFQQEKIYMKSENGLLEIVLSQLELFQFIRL